jgi:hypothetical protein
MGFMDKAKKLAEQAQEKLDEVQKQFNEGRPGAAAPQGGPVVEYDQHGRPIRTEESETSTPPHGDPLGGAAAAPPPAAPPAAPVPDPAAPPAPEGDRTIRDPAAPGAPEKDRNHPSYAPPKLSEGDPLAG